MAREALESLDVLVGEWRLTTSFAADPSSAPLARTTFEWLPGRRFLIQRWEVDHPDAPDGIAIIGFDEQRGMLLQHYFDSRGVARVYEMTFAGGKWTLERHGSDFSQRFTATLAGGDTIEGRWEKSRDGGRWEHDLDLTYTRVRS